MKIPFKNTSLFYTVQGNGRPLVLIHGFLESSQIWKASLPQLSKHWKVISLDLPGHGNSGSIGEIHEMTLMAEAIFMVLKNLRIENTGIVGHSMGGYAALAFLEKYPDMVRSLTLLNSTPAADSESRQKMRERSVVMVKNSKQTFIRMAISNLLPPESKKKHQLEIENLIRHAQKFPTRGIINNLEGMKIRTDKTNVLRKFGGEKILISGEADPLMDHQQAVRLAETTGCRLFSLPGGHLSYIEQRENFEKLCISSKKKDF